MSNLVRDNDAGAFTMANTAKSSTGEFIATLTFFLGWERWGCVQNLDLTHLLIPNRGKPPCFYHDCDDSDYLPAHAKHQQETDVWPIGVFSYDKWENSIQGSQDVKTITAVHANRTSRWICTRFPCALGENEVHGTADIVIEREDIVEDFERPEQLRKIKPLAQTREVI